MTSDQLTQQQAAQGARLRGAVRELRLFAEHGDDFERPGLSRTEARTLLDAVRERDQARDALRQIREAAKAARAQAAAPDYDEEAIRGDLWRVVHLALTVEVSA